MDIRRIDNPPEVLARDLQLQILTYQTKLKFVLDYLKQIEAEEERMGITDLLVTLKQEWNMVI